MAIDEIMFEMLVHKKEERPSACSLDAVAEAL
jgi:hypothetical protein